MLHLETTLLHFDYRVVACHYCMHFECLLVLRVLRSQSHLVAFSMIFIIIVFNPILLNG